MPSSLSVRLGASSIKLVRWGGFLLHMFSSLRSRYSDFEQGAHSIIHRMTVGEATIFEGLPIIEMAEGSEIILGNNVYLDSTNKYYHLNMYRPAKLIAGNGARITIGDNTRIHGSCINAQKRVSIGNECLIAANCQIMDSNGHVTALEEPSLRLARTDDPRDVIIEDGVWLGTNVTVLPGSKIGAGAIVAAGSVVRGIIPSKSIAFGVPAQVVKSIGG